MMGVNAELVTEYAKDKVWEDAKEVFNNQAYIFGKQFFRITRCQEKVDVIITDSPILLSVIYNKSKMLGEEFNNLVIKVDSYYQTNSLNYLIIRNKPYNEKGRFQTEEQSNQLFPSIKDLLTKNNICHREILGDSNGYQTIINDILNRLDINTGVPSFYGEELDK